MQYIFQFGIIAGFCFLGEVCRAVLPLPIPASVYGLVLLLAALKTGIVKLEKIRKTALFLIGILPLLFVPAAAGIMEQVQALKELWLPILIALVPVTVLVMAAAGRATQKLAKKEDKAHAE